MKLRRLEERFFCDELQNINDAFVVSRTCTSGFLRNKSLSAIDCANNKAGKTREQEKIPFHLL
jgi:hypothetical protein